MPPNQKKTVSKVKIIKSKKSLKKPIKKIDLKGGDLKSTDDGLEDFEEDTETESDYEAIEEQRDEDDVVGKLEENTDEIENDDALGDNMDYDGKEGADELEEVVSDSGEAEGEVEADGEGYEAYKDDGDESCFVKFAGKKKKPDADSDDDDDLGDEDEAVLDDNEETEDTIESKYVTADQRISKPVLTKFERVRILSDRAKQLLLGAKPMIKNTDNLGPKEIARLELEHGVIPFSIERPLPNGKIEIWKIKELRIVN
jgi:DNA-directed RNA polymerase subunit K/omega